MGARGAFRLHFDVDREMYVHSSSYKERGAIEISSLNATPYKSPCETWLLFTVLIFPVEPRKEVFLLLKLSNSTEFRELGQIFINTFRIIALANRVYLLIFFKQSNFQKHSG